MTEPDEVNFDLDGQTISEAVARLTEIAARMDYYAVASGPRTFQLVRRRRHRMRQKIETMTLTFVEDRSGPRVRVIGDVDILLVEHLTGRVGEELRQDASSRIVVEPTFTPVFQAPTVHFELPSSDDRVVRPSSPAVGLISVVPGTTPEPESERPFGDSNDDPIGVGDLPTNPVNGANGRHSHDDDRLSALTVQRPAATSSPTQPQAVVETADGNTTVFDSSAVVGRNPNPAVGPPGAAVVAVADPSLSKSHCVLAIVDQQLVVTDMHSMNGTRVEASDGSQTLIPGQSSRPLNLPVVVWAGAVRLEVRSQNGAIA